MAIFVWRLAEAGLEAANMVRRATDGTGEQMGDAFPKIRVSFETDGVGEDDAAGFH